MSDSALGHNKGLVFGHQTDYVNVFPLIHRAGTTYVYLECLWILVPKGLNVIFGLSNVYDLS